MNRIVNIIWLKSFKALNLGQSQRVLQICKGFTGANFPALSFSSSIEGKSAADRAAQDEAAEKKKKKMIPRITLISEGDKVEIATLEEAQKLASRRNLKLVRIVDLDTKTQRPIYKLMTGQQYYAEELKQREARKSKKGNLKGEKLLTISSRIASHDLQAKANLVTKWVQKNYEIRVIITRDGAENSKMEQIAKDIEKVAAQDGRILQRRASSSDVRFSILPLKAGEDDSGTSSESESTSSKDPPKSEKPSGGSNQPSTDPKNKQQVRSYHSESS